MGRRLVEKRPGAIQDLVDTALYLAETSENDALAFRFLDAAQATFERLVAMPALGAPGRLRHPALAHVRVWRVTGFRNHLIFYRPTDSGIEVLRVLHGKRDLDALFALPDEP